MPRASWLRSRAPHREIRLAGFKQKDPSSGVQVEGSGQPEPVRGIQAAGSSQKDPDSRILAAWFRQRDVSRRLQASEFQNEVQAEESVQRGTSRGIRTEESGQSEPGSRVEAAAPGGRAARGGSGRAAPRTGDGRVRRSRGRRASGGRGLGPERASERASRRKSERESEERGGVSARRRPRAAPGQPDPQALRSWRSHRVPGGPRVPSLSTDAGAARQGGRVPDVSLQTQSVGQLSLHRGALFSVPEGPTRQCPDASTHSPSNLGSHTDCI